MPIIDAQDARDLDSHLQLFFDSNPAERPHRLRLLFTEKFDFNTATGKVSLVNAPQNVTLPSDADRIASIEGINVVYVPLQILARNPLALPLDGISLTTLLPPRALRYPSKPLRPIVKSISTTLSANALDKAFTSVALWATKPSPERLPSIFSCSI